MIYDGIGYHLNSSNYEFIDDMTPAGVSLFEAR